MALVLLALGVNVPQLQLPPLPRWQAPDIQLPRLRLPKLPQWCVGRGATSGQDTSEKAVAEFVAEGTGAGDDWKLKVDKANVRVWSRKVKGSPFAELRGNGILDAPPARVLALLQAGDAETIRLYNPMYDQGYDLQQLDKQTKVSYGTARSIFPFKPRDTVTRVAFRDLGGGASVLVLHAVEHRDKPVTGEYVRAKIIRGMHLMQPVHNVAGKTNFTFTQQINVGGVLPAWLTNVLITQDAVQFVQRLGKTAGSRRWEGHRAAEKAAVRATTTTTAAGVATTTAAEGVGCASATLSSGSTVSGAGIVAQNAYCINSAF